MQFPIINTKTEKHIYTNAFGGINKTEFATPSEFSYMKNMSSDCFPALSQSVKKDAVQINADIKEIACALSPGYSASEMVGFTGVADGKFYYQNKYIPCRYPFMSLKGAKQLIDLGGRIIIAPQMYSYEYLDEVKKGFILPLAEGCYDQQMAKVYSTTSGSRLTSFNINSQSSDTWAKLGFSVGDSIIVKVTDENDKELEVIPLENKYEACGTYQIVSAVVASIDGHKMDVHMYNKKGEDSTIYQKDQYGNEVVFSTDYSKSDVTGDIIVYRYIPEMNNICLHKNRLWGTSKSGNKIYASAPANPSQFFALSGLSTDSWFTEVDNSGEFTGIRPFGGNVLAFKENSIYHIFGDRASNFNIPKVINNCGCIDSRSICETDTAIYFLASDGVYEYSGGAPKNISKNLGISEYFSAGAFSDGKKYYFSPNDEEHVFAYDREKRLWHTEAMFNLVCGIKFNNKIYFYAKDKMYKNSDSFDVPWEVVFCDITEESFEHKGINNIYLRIKNSENSYAEVFVSSGDASPVFCGRTDEAGEYTFRIPVRFKKGDRYKIKISGEGKCLITALERVVYKGGRAETRKG